MVGGAPVAVTAGGAPFPGERPLGRPVAPKEEESRVPPGGGLLLLLLAKDCMVPLPGEGGATTRDSATQTWNQSVSRWGGRRGRGLRRGPSGGGDGTRECVGWLKVRSYLAVRMYLNFDWAGSFPVDSGRVYPVGKTTMTRYKRRTHCSGRMSARSSVGTLLTDLFCWLD